MKFKIGDIVKDKCTGNKCVIVEKYQGVRFNWEVFPISPKCNDKFKDCRKESDLEIYNWKNYPKTFKEKLKLLFKK